MITHTFVSLTCGDPREIHAETICDGLYVELKNGFSPVMTITCHTRDQASRLVCLLNEIVHYEEPKEKAATDGN